MRFEIFAHNMQNNHIVTILFLLIGVIMFIVGILGLIAPYFDEDSGIRNFFGADRSSIIQWIILLSGLVFIGFPIKIKINQT